MGFLGDASGKESACRFKRLETHVHSLGWEDSLEKAMATALVFLPRECHGQRILEGYGPQGCKVSDGRSQMSHGIYFIVRSSIKSLNMAHIKERKKESSGIKTLLIPGHVLAFLEEVLFNILRESIVSTIIERQSLNLIYLSKSSGWIHFFSWLQKKLYVWAEKSMSHWVMKMKSESVSCSVVYDSLQPHGLYSPQNSPGQNTGVGSLSLLQGLFSTQGLNPGIPDCGQILYQLSHKGSPRTLEWVAYPSSRRSSWPRNWTTVSCIAGGLFTNREIIHIFR